MSRYLKRARDEGIVHVEIRPPRRHHVELGRELAGRLGLERAMVLALEGEGPDSLFALAAEHIGSLLHTGMRVGISWGQTLAGVVRFLQPRAVSDLSISQLTGGLADVEPGNQGHELVRHLAQLYPNSRVKYLHAPAIVDSERIQRALLSDRAIRTSLDEAARCQLAFVGIGSMGLDATLIRVGALSEADRDQLVRDGAVGTLNSRFFTAEGRPLRYLDAGRSLSTGTNWRASPPSWLSRREDPRCSHRRGDPDRLPAYPDHRRNNGPRPAGALNGRAGDPVLREVVANRRIPSELNGTQEQVIRRPSAVGVLAAR